MERHVKRERTEITQDILRLCCKPVKKTQILYKCNLSFDLLQKYLKYLMSRNLLAKNSDGLFQATDKGKEFLETYENLETLIAS
jgi:predicted transcriptional regulator